MLNSCVGDDWNGAVKETKQKIPILMNLYVQWEREEYDIQVNQ